MRSHRGEYHFFHPHRRRHRARGALIVGLSALGVLVVSLLRLQVLRADELTLQADANRLRPYRVTAPRGTIYDRHGKTLAVSRPGYTLRLSRLSVDSAEAALFRVAPYLNIDSAGVRDLLERRRLSPTHEIIIKRNLTRDELARIEERLYALDGVDVESYPHRFYTIGAATAHVVGHVSEISSAELKAGSFPDVEQGQDIGKSGVERTYDALLRGRDGLRYVEVDARGNVRREIESLGITPVSGEALTLSLDADLQQWVAGLFPDTVRGSIIAIEPRSGEILAMYSAPSYDANSFVGGVDPVTWRSLMTDPAKPMMDRSIDGIYPPASTFKLATAAIALELGLVRPDEHLPVACRGGMQFGNRYFRCWKPEGHGSLDLADAIQNSCNVYFYQLGQRIGLNRLLAEGTRMGFGRVTGVDLPGEASGIFPSGPEFFNARFGRPAAAADVLSLAIGQGPNSQTVLRMAHLYAALAAGGRSPAPHLRHNEPPTDTLDLHIASVNLEALREGLRRVTLPGGTAYLSSLEHWDLWGKTGTAQNPHGLDHGWFAGMAGPRGGGQEIVIVAIMEFAEHGSTTAQFVAKAADRYLRARHAIPFDSVQTLGEHYRRGKPAPWARR